MDSNRTVVGSSSAATPVKLISDTPALMSKGRSWRTMA
jgi:hypothetical protein